jgi:tetratricopeptide (TPR) repeat protein
VFFLNRSVLIIIFLTVFISALPQQVRKNEPFLKAEAVRQNELKILERQLSYVSDLEKKGNYASAYNSYLQLLRNYDNDFRVLSGFTEAAIRTGRIKECEVRLKEAAVKYPSKPGFIDKNDAERVYPLMIKALLAELFFRTERDDQASLIIDEIDRAEAGKDLISSIKAYIFFKSARYDKAEKLYLSLRKESKSSAYSEELFYIYLSTERITRAVSELFKMAEVNESSSGTDDQRSINPSAELFALFDDPQYKDSVLSAAEKQKLTPSNSELLSELYFNQGKYEKALSVLDQKDKSGSREMLLADFAVRLYSEKKYAEAVSFFERAAGLSGNRTDDFTELYIKSLILSGRADEAVKVLKKSRIKDKDLQLAEIYHNSLDSLDKADMLYNRVLVSPNENRQYWKDYIKLKIAKKDFIVAEELLKKVTATISKDKRYSNELNDLKYLEAVLELLKDDPAQFIKKSDTMIRDQAVTDQDNDLLKAVSDVKAIIDKKDILELYKTMTAHKTDKSFKLNDLECDIGAVTDDAVKTVYYETRLYILTATNDKAETVKLMNTVTNSGLINNNLAKMFTDYCRTKNSDPELNSVMMILLKSGIGDEIKAEIREVIREKQIS